MYDGAHKRLQKLDCLDADLNSTKRKLDSAKRKLDSTKSKLDLKTSNTALHRNSSRMVVDILNSLLYYDDHGYDYD